VKIRAESSFNTQGGIWTREATYQIRERAKALITNDLPRKDKERDCQDFSTLSTAVMLSRPPVVFFKVPNADKHAKGFDFNRAPI